MFKHFGKAFGEVSLKPMLRFREFQLKGQSIIVKNAEQLESMKDRPFIVVSNHIGPIESLGKFDIESGLTPDVVLLAKTIEMIGKKSPFIIAGINDELLGQSPAFKHFRDVFTSFSQGLLSSIHAISANKMSGRRDNSSLIASASEVLSANNVILTFGEGVWRSREHDYSKEISIKSSTGLIAKHAQVSILPVFIDCSEKWENLDTSRIYFGNPIEPENLASNDLKSMIADQIVSLQKRSLSPNPPVS
ncbi:hypothetical protein IT417_00035 [bacterium]|nr:hypothetical protein [bacterium]